MREELVPWKKRFDLIVPFYLKSGKPGRPHVELERMLRIHCLQHVFNRSDPAAEVALYLSQAMCAFFGIDLDREPVPEETTILNVWLPRAAENATRLFAAFGIINLFAARMRLLSGTSGCKARLGTCPVIRASHSSRSE